MKFLTWRVIGCVAALTLAGGPAARAESLLLTADAVSGQLFAVSPADGTAVPVGGLGIPDRGTLLSLAYDGGTDTLYGLGANSPNSLFTINRASGAASLVGEVVAPVGNRFFSGITFDPGTGTLVAVSPLSEGTEFYRIDPATAVPTLIGATDKTFPSAPGGGLAFDAATNTLYSGVGDTIFGDDGVGFVVVTDLTTLQSRVVRTTVPVSFLAFDPETRTLFAVENRAFTQGSRLFVLDPETGAATFRGSVNITNPLGLVFVSGEAIPEPGTLVLLGAGAVGLLGWARCRRRGGRTHGG